MFVELKNLLRQLRPQSREERETAYLNGSQDRIDLELRIRAIDRGMFR